MYGKQLAPFQASRMSLLTKNLGKLDLRQNGHLTHTSFINCKECGFTWDIGLFVSRLDNKCKNYIFYHLDPGAQAVNAFSISWGDLKRYVFPPFSITLKVLHKVNSENATWFIVVPHWPTQSYSTDVLIAKPLIYLCLKGFIQSARPSDFHYVSDDYSRVTDFPTQLHLSYFNSGELYWKQFRSYLHRWIIPFQRL